MKTDFVNAIVLLQFFGISLLMCKQSFDKYSDVQYYSIMDLPVVQ